MLRDWTTSEKIDQLSEIAELFFVRLIMKADDHGCFHANPKLLKAALFPLKDYTENQMTSCLRELTKASIIQVYESDGRKYLKINDFGQRLRTMVSKFPQPADNCPQVADECLPELEEKRREEEYEYELRVWPSFDDFWDKYQKKVDRAKCEKKWNKVGQAEREKIMAHLDLYIPSTPDVKYRKDPATYLNNKSWENEIIQDGKTRKGIDVKSEIESIYNRNQ